MKLRTVMPIALLAMSACGGIASIDLFFFSQAPARDGSGNIAITVTEGIGTARTVIEEHVERFDESFDVAKIRLPYGITRIVSATIETDEAQPRTVFGGISNAFPLEESDSPSLFIDMAPVPAPGTVRVIGGNSGRVASATVSLAVTLSNGFPPNELSVSEDPSFAPARTDTFSLTDPRVMLSGNPLVATFSFVLDAGCGDQSGCARTIYLKNLDVNRFESDVYSTSLIYDPYPPQLVDVTVRLDRGSVLGTSGTAFIDVEFDEEVLETTFASLSGGAPSCPGQVEAVDGMLSGLDFTDNCAGTYDIEVMASDLAGNSVRLFELATLVVDRLAPPPIDLAVVTSTCVAGHAIILGGPGAADPRASVDASGARARADAQGAFVVVAEPGEVDLLQIDTAGNESPSQTFEVMSCGS